MANDGSRWVTAADISERDAGALERLWLARETVLDEAQHQDSFETFSTGDKRVWYAGCPCSACQMTNERLDVAQAELEAAYRSVAITSEIADGSMAEGWMRVRAWFETGKKAEAKRYQANAAGKRSGSPGARSRVQ